MGAKQFNGKCAYFSTNDSRNLDIPIQNKFRRLSHTIDKNEHKIDYMYTRVCIVYI